MIRFLKPILRKTIPLFDEDNHNIGKVPVRIARELVDTKHAKVIQNNPTIIGLKQLGRSSCKPNGKAVTNTPPKKLSLCCQSIYCQKLLQKDTQHDPVQSR